MGFAHFPLAPFFLLSFLVSSYLPSSMSLGFTCNYTTRTTCQAMVGYVSPNTTTLSTIQTLFNVKHLRSILGANSFPLSTPSNATVNQNQVIKIPFNCSCSNSTGISYKRPIYTVRSGDFLYHVATEVFSNLVTVTDIQSVSGIANASFIEVGQNLTIPLPCSCDDVDGEAVVHYGHVVAAGSSVAEIAENFNVSQSILMTLNGIADVKDLKAGQVLDVPLKACASTIRNDSLDSSLLLSNGTYTFTANNCIMCRCSSDNWKLQCESSQAKPSNWSTCPSMQCGGTELYLGNSTSASCNTTTCAYAGYTAQTILTTLDTVSTCPAPNKSARKNSLHVDFLVILVFLWLSFHQF